MDVPWFCYMLRCSDGALYVGAAKDLAVRLRRHNAGFGAKFTAKRRPVELIWWQGFDSEKEARGPGGAIKGLETGEEVGAPVEFW